MTPATVGRMPTKGSTRRSFRDDDDEVWAAFVAKAKREGTDASAKIREFIRKDLEAWRPIPTSKETR